MTGPAQFKGAEVSEVTSVSGAGDCFISAFMSGILLKGLDQETAVEVGFEAARCSLASFKPVPSAVNGLTFLK